MFVEPPRNVTAAKHTMAIKATIRQYSTIVAPSSPLSLFLGHSTLLA